MRLTIMVVSCLVLFPSSAWSGDEARKKADAAMLKKLTGTWDLHRPDRKPSKFAQNGDVWWDIDPELIVITYHDGQTEQFQHKPFIDTSKNPMWLDLMYYRDQRVALGIFKLEGDRLIYLEGKRYPVKEWQKAKGNLPGRPKDFNVKKGDEDRKQILLRSAPPMPEKKEKQTGSGGKLMPSPGEPAQEPRQVFTEAHYPGGVAGMAFSPDGKRLASVGLFGGLQVRHLASGKKYTAPKARAWCVAYHPAGKLIATGAHDGTITLWDADSLKPRTTLKGHTARVWAVSFNSTGNLLASASTDKTVKLWDMDTGQEKATLRHPHYVYEAVFLKGDKLLASGSDALRLWEVATGKQTAALKPKGSDEVSLLAVSPDGNTVAFAPDGELAKPPVILWDIRTRRERPGPDLRGQVASSLAFSPDGKLLAVGITDEALLWDIRAGKEKAVLNGHYGPPNLLTFSPDSATLAAGDYEGTIRLWDTKARPKRGR